MVKLKNKIPNIGPQNVNKSAVYINYIDSLIDLFLFFSSKYVHFHFNSLQFFLILMSVRKFMLFCVALMSIW